MLNLNFEYKLILVQIRKSIWILASYPSNETGQTKIITTITIDHNSIRHSIFDPLCDVRIISCGRHIYAVLNIVVLDNNIG